MKKVYEWKIPSFAKGIPPKKAIKELQRIENVYGSLTAKSILEASTDNNAVFHELFTWDDTEAANLYRLQQARSIVNNIEVTIISDGQERIIPVYEIINTGEGRSYKQIYNLSSDEISQVKDRTLRDLNNLRSKLSLYSQFEKATVKIGEVIEIMESA